MHKNWFVSSVSLSHIERPLQIRRPLFGKLFYVKMAPHIWLNLFLYALFYCMRATDFKLEFPNFTKPSHQYSSYLMF